MGQIGRQPARDLSCASPTANPVGRWEESAGCAVHPPLWLMWQLPWLCCVRASPRPAPPTPRPSTGDRIAQSDQGRQRALILAFLEKPGELLGRLRALHAPQRLLRAPGPDSRGEPVPNGRRDARMALRLERRSPPDCAAVDEFAAPPRCSDVVRLPPGRNGHGARTSGRTGHHHVGGPLRTTLRAAALRPRACGTASTVCASRPRRGRRRGA